MSFIKAGKYCEFIYAELAPYQEKRGDGEWQWTSLGVRGVAHYSRQSQLTLFDKFWCWLLRGVNLRELF